MKKIIASLIIGCATLAMQAQNVPSTNQIPVESHVKPLAALIFKGENAAVVESQLFAITNAAGKPVFGSLSQTNISHITLQVTQTNGLPQRVTMVVR
ncbi:MAG TPA: hypothetical protein VIK62_06475 [Verrucomicrobiae bacterium]